jgi:hypothetical protein
MRGLARVEIDKFNDKNWHLGHASFWNGTVTNAILILSLKLLPNLKFLS